MNRAEKILEYCCDNGTMSHGDESYLDIERNVFDGKAQHALEAMRAIAWEAWKKSVNLMWGVFTPKGEGMAKEEFNEWYNEHLLPGEIALKPRKDRGDAFKQEYLEWELFLRKKNISAKDREEILRKMFNA